METAKALYEEEYIFGARKRERFWKITAIVTTLFGVIGCVTAGQVALKKEVPPPLLIPYDALSGLPIPNIDLQAYSVNQPDMVVQSLIYQYVTDREGFDPLDNDLRVARLEKRSSGAALRSLAAVWNPASANYPPTIYKGNTKMFVEVSSIRRLDSDRAQARIIKRLVSDNGSSEAIFTVTMRFQFDASEVTNLKSAWENPFGFSVTDYSVASERFSQ